MLPKAQHGAWSASQEALAKENQREQELQKKITAMDSKTLAQRKESWITQELIERF